MVDQAFPSVRCSYCGGILQEINRGDGAAVYDEPATLAVFATHRSSAAAPGGAGCTSAQPWATDPAADYSESTLRASIGSSRALGARKVVALPYTASAEDRYLATTGAGTLTLPPASRLPNGQGVDVKNTHSASITVQRQGADTLDGGATSATLLSNMARRYVSNGADKYEVN